MLRSDGRVSGQTRPLRITPHFTKHADGSVLIEFGDTKVICSVFIEDNVPGFLRNSNPPQGWLTAEYSMLPSATNTRSKRERPSPSGRTQEIQRLIGRSLRGILDLRKIPDRTILIDCDVIQADGGTRTASITGAYVALQLAVNKLIGRRAISQNPLIEPVAAISIGLKNGSLLVDMDYSEDSSADLDMNVVMTQSGKILEIQGTAEKQSFSKSEVLQIIEAAESALQPIFEIQNTATEGRIAEG